MRTSPVGYAPAAARLCATPTCATASTACTRPCWSLPVATTSRVRPICRASSRTCCGRKLRYAELGGAGHLVPLERPDEFARALSTFLGEHAT